MRIAVYHNLPFGGAVRVMREQIRGLGVRAEDVFDLTQAGPQWKPLSLLGRPFGRLNGAVHMANLIRLTNVSREIAGRMDEGGYDVVLVHPCAVAQSPPILRFLNTRSVYYCQEPFRALHEALLKGGVFLPMGDPLRGLYSRLAVSNESKALSSATKVLCNSRYSRESILRLYGVDATVNYLGVDTDLFAPTGEAKECLVLSVGRLSPAKGHDFVIESLATVPQSQRPRLGIVCGPADSEARDELQKLALEVGVEATFYEDVSDQTLVSLYNRSVCAVVAHILEPFGLVPLEAMACGTAVVSVAEGGLRESVVDGVTGFLTQRDHAEFGAAIVRLLSDPALAAEMGRAGRQHVMANWNWDRSIAQLESVLRSVAGATVDADNCSAA